MGRSPILFFFTDFLFDYYDCPSAIFRYTTSNKYGVPTIVNKWPWECTFEIKTVQVVPTELKLEQGPRYSRC